jgi:hypothetical protein
VLPNRVTPLYLETASSKFPDPASQSAEEDLRLFRRGAVLSRPRNSARRSGEPFRHLGPAWIESMIGVRFVERRTGSCRTKTRSATAVTGYECRRWPTSLPSLSETGVSRALLVCAPDRRPDSLVTVPSSNVARALHPIHWRFSLGIIGSLPRRVPFG